MPNAHLQHSSFLSFFCQFTFQMSFIIVSKPSLLFQLPKIINDLAKLAVFIICWTWDAIQFMDLNWCLCQVFDDLAL